jgi:hypothetical protein
MRKRRGGRSQTICRAAGAGVTGPASMYTPKIITGPAEMKINRKIFPRGVDF